MPYEGSESKLKDETPLTEEPFTPTQGRSLGEGVTELAVEGAPLFTSSGTLRAVMALDLDADGDRDALVVRTEEGLRTVLAFAPRDGSSFGAMNDLATIAEGCSVDQAGLRTLSRRFAVVELSLTCDGQRERGLALVALEHTPRVGERLRIADDASGGSAPLGLAVQTRDVDEDGFEDAVIELGVTMGTSEGIRVALPFFDRPGGLARDAREPEATFADLGKHAKEALKADPKSASALATATFELYRALCREGGAPRVRFGESLGLACGQSIGAGRAAAVRAAALAKQDLSLEALDALAALESSALEVTADDRALVDRAFGSAPSREKLSLRKIGVHPAPPRAPDARRSALAFLDDETLVLRGESPALVRLSEKKAVAMPEDASQVELRDPSGRFAVLDVVRTCAGIALRIVRANELVAGVLAGRPVSELLVESRPPPAGVSCPRKDPIPGAASGFQLLGWAPQGIVVARGSEVRVVPVTLEGEPAGASTLLDPSAALPAPLPAGAAHTDGSHYAVPTPYGVLLVARIPGGKTRLLRPPGWESAGPPISDLAIAPDARRVAFLRGNDVWLIEGLE